MKRRASRTFMVVLREEEGDKGKKVYEI